jgi:hypothetical protein
VKEQQKCTLRSEESWANNPAKQEPEVISGQPIGLGKTFNTLFLSWVFLYLFSGELIAWMRV